MVLFNISKEETLIKLWEGTKTVGLGFIHSDRKPTIKDVKEHFEKYGDYIDYFYGRPIKVDFSKHPNLNSIGYSLVDIGTTLVFIPLYSKIAFVKSYHEATPSLL